MKKIYLLLAILLVIFSLSSLGFQPASGWVTIRNGCDFPLTVYYNCLEEGLEDVKSGPITVDPGSEKSYMLTPWKGSAPACKEAPLLREKIHQFIIFDPQGNILFSEKLSPFDLEARNKNIGIIP